MDQLFLNLEGVICRLPGLCYVPSDPCITGVRTVSMSSAGGHPCHDSSCDFLGQNIAAQKRCGVCLVMVTSGFDELLQFWGHFTWYFAPMRLGVSCSPRWRSSSSLGFCETGQDVDRQIGADLSLIWAWYQNVVVTRERSGMCLSRYRRSSEAAAALLTCCSR